MLLQPFASLSRLRPLVASLALLGLVAAPARAELTLDEVKSLIERMEQHEEYRFEKVLSDFALSRGRKPDQDLVAYLRSKLESYCAETAPLGTDYLRKQMDLYLTRVEESANKYHQSRVALEARQLIELLSSSSSDREAAEKHLREHLEIRLSYWAALLEGKYAIPCFEANLGFGSPATASTPPPAPAPQVTTPPPSASRPPGPIESYAEWSVTCSDLQKASGSLWLYIDLPEGEHSAIDGELTLSTGVGKLTGQAWWASGAAVGLVPGARVEVDFEPTSSDAKVRMVPAGRDVPAALVFSGTLTWEATNAFSGGGDVQLDSCWGEWSVE